MIIGITGKSGSGKSDLAHLLGKSLNGVEIHFDEVSHTLVQSVWYANFIEQNFGKDFIENGKVNRKKLGEIVFRNPQKLKMINDACQPHMEEIIDKIIQENNSKIIILEYALLPLMKYFQNCDLKVLLECDINERKERVIKRDKISEEYFHFREENSVNYTDFKFDLKFNTKSTSLEMISKNIISKIGENL